MRSVNIQKGSTLFCTPERIPPVAAKIIQGVSVGLSVPDRTTNG
ncbi:hypothetical protein DENIT_11716 [Pseudomonas veronii]|nr:hypothetical protein DENIT_11716 [Pseudomonas veronii]